MRNTSRKDSVNLIFWMSINAKNPERKEKTKKMSKITKNTSVRGPWMQKC